MTTLAGRCRHGDGRLAGVRWTAGGDLVLTVEPKVIPGMTAAVLPKAQRDPVFQAQVDAAALRALSAKHARGLFS